MNRLTITKFTFFLLLSSLIGVCITGETRNYRNKINSDGQPNSVRDHFMILPGRISAEPVLVNGGFKINVYSAVQLDWEIVPGKRAGAIDADSSEAGLKKIYGNRNVRSAEIDLGEGETETGTIVYPENASRRVEITWKDPENKTYPRFVRLRGKKSRWQTGNGISLGTSLKKLEQINGKAFMLNGFGWDYSGTVVSWEGGKIGSGLILRLNSKKSGGEEFADIQGDDEFSSQNPLMQRLNPRVYEIMIEFPDKVPDPVE